MAYSAQHKALAVAIVNRHGGQASKSAMSEIHETLGIQASERTVLNWLKEAQAVTAKPGANTEISPEKKRLRPLTPGLLQEAEGALSDLFERIIRLATTRVIQGLETGDIKGRDAMTILGIAYDKRQVELNLPTEIIGLLPGLIARMEQRGLNPPDVFWKLDEKVRQGALN